MSKLRASFIHPTDDYWTDEAINGQAMRGNALWLTVETEAS